MIVPHTAGRQSHKPNLGPDPWYETEENPNFDAGSFLDNFKYRVKNGRPALRCTQNDTYTYKGTTVNHVNKLPELPGLKLSPFIMNKLFPLEFQGPVFSKVLGNLPFGTFKSATYFYPNTRELDPTRASLYDDFKGLVDLSFVYSREVVRNTVLLYSVLGGLNDSQFRNAAENGTIAKNADFFLEDAEVAAMSVFLLVMAPCVCAFLWILVLWRRRFNAESVLDNKSAQARHDLRLHGFQAVHLFQYLDEALSNGSRKWSGRNTDSPYIRDLDAEKAAKQDANQPATSIPPAHKTSLYAKPKVVPVVLDQGSLQSARFRDEVWDVIKQWFGRDSQATRRPQFEVAMTREWNPNIPKTKWVDICRDS